MESEAQQVTGIGKIAVDYEIGVVLRSLAPCALLSRVLAKAFSPPRTC